jgi:hypothetical protein
MAGEEACLPVEPSKTHTRVGRGGVGNYQEATRTSVNDIESPPRQVQPLVCPRIYATDEGQEPVNVSRSTGRGGSGNIRPRPDPTAGPQRRPSFEGDGSTVFGRGGVGNIEAARMWRKQKEEELAKKEAVRAEEARAAARAVAASIQMPKPTWSAP